MKDFFKGVRKHIGKLDAEHLREQYSLVTDELAFSEMIFHTTSDGYLVLDEAGVPKWANHAAERLLGMKPEDILPTLDIPLSKSSKREIEIRKDLTDQWKEHGVEEGTGYATLTDIIYQTWAGLTARVAREAFEQQTGKKVVTDLSMKRFLESQQPQLDFSEGKEDEEE